MQCKIFEIYHRIKLFFHSCVKFQSHSSLMELVAELNVITIGTLSQRKSFEWRTNVIHRFRKGEIKILVATYGYISALKISTLKFHALFNVPILKDEIFDTNAYLSAISCIGRNWQKSVLFNLLNERELAAVDVAGKKLNLSSTTIVQSIQA